MPVQLQYVQLTRDKTNTADLSTFASFISVHQDEQIQNPLPFHNFRQKLANSNATKETLNCTMYCHFMQADSNADAISFIGVLFCDPKTRLP